MENKLNLNVGNAVQYENGFIYLVVEKEMESYQMMTFEHKHEKKLELLNLKTGTKMSVCKDKIEKVYEDYTMSKLIYERPQTKLTKEECDQLYELLKKIKKQRVEEYKAHDPETDFTTFSEDDWYDYDDGDNLISSVDSLLSIVKEM